ncbi:unannotated protein [freshwater metagenome]|uniref:Unannotated protein n=1 Tax=freshwater metagenome TaxID=449393 RepID=A0A6J7Q8D1_9ZZZZ
MSGTVCDAMTKGRSPRSMNANRCIVIARSKPTATPTTKPPIAIMSEYAAAVSTAWSTVVEDPRISGWKAPFTIVQMFGMVMSLVLNGNGTTLPTALTSSHMIIARRMPRRAHPAEAAPRFSRRPATRERTGRAETEGEATRRESLTDVSLLLPSREG